MVTTVLRLANGDLIAGGSFAIADGSFMRAIARFDGTRWHAMGSGFAGSVNALAQLPNGDVIAGGWFTLSGSTVIRRLARWDGSTWSELAAAENFGLTCTVSALQVMPNGDLFVGGSFATVAGQPSRYLARRTAAGNWLPLGDVLGLSATVQAFAVDANGDLLIGGSFATTAGAPANGLARWNGSTFAPIPLPALGAAAISALQPLPNGSLAIAGFLNGQRLATWDGSQVQFLTSPVLQASRLALAPTGELLVGGLGAAGPVLVASIGGGWVDLSAGLPGGVRTMRVAGGTLFVGDLGVFQLTTTGWSELSGSPPPPSIRALRTLRDGSVAIAGDFRSLGGVAANNIARWNGGGYAALGLGVDATVTCMAVADNGDLLVGGNFSNAGGTPAARVARWNGTNWTTLGAGLPSAPRLIAGGPGGEVIAALGLQPSTLQRFSGGVWNAVATGVTGTLLAMAQAPDGSLLLGGSLSLGGANYPIVRGSGGTFTPAVPSGTSSVSAIASRGDEVVVFGSILSSPGPLVSGAARLVAGNLVPVGSSAGASSFHDGAFLADGSLLAVSLSQFPLQRFDGANWTAVPGFDVTLQRLATAADGSFFVSGGFLTVGSQVSVGLARATPTCPAAATPYGAGCSGAAGPVALAAAGLPWAGSAFSATAAVLPNNSLALFVVGTSQQVVPLPLGAAGCFLFTDPIEVQLALPLGGSATGSVLLPAGAAVAGLQARAQMVVAEFAASGFVSQLTSSNALELTLGAL